MAETNFSGPVNSAGGFKVGAAGTANTSGHFRARKTGTAAWTLYRLA